jgi:hypothetical protein
MANAKLQSTFARPRRFACHGPAAAWIQPNGCSTTLRKTWLTAWPGWRVVRASIALRRRDV